MRRKSKTRKEIQKAKLFTYNETFHILQLIQMPINFLERKNSGTSGPLEVVGLLTRTDALK